MLNASNKLKFIISALILAAVFILPKVGQAAPPTGFSSTQIIGSGLNGPTGFDIAPDGRIFILEREGLVKIFKNGALLPTPFTNLPSEATGDRGLAGIAFDPDFATNHYVYFYHTGTDLHNHLVRFDATGDVGTGKVELYATPQNSELFHIGGTVQFGPIDGKIYLSIGDNGYRANAQDLSNPYGKIIRLNKDGTIPSDNPFVGQAGRLPEIWAYGFRNPFRFQFDQETGDLYEGDVGEFDWEEVNKVIKSGNYGWPNAEGMCVGCPYINPVYTYAHNGLSRAIAMGPFYHNHSGVLPAGYDHSLFYGDYAGGFIKRAVFDEFGTFQNVVDFDLAAGSVVDLKTAPDGSIYYVTFFPGRLYKITYSPVNGAPIANASADVTKGVPPLTVHFSSAGSSDPEGTPLTYLWDFGDGTTSTQANPFKTYNNVGVYLVELTVSDGSNPSAAAPIIIQVGTLPSVFFGSPIDGSHYNAGDTINYSSFGTDGAGFDLPESAFSAEIIFHHGTHIHPFLGPIPGSHGAFVIPTTGEISADTWYEIKITATDTNGLYTSASRFVFPNKSNFTVMTSPQSFTVFIDGIPKTTPQVTQSVVGFLRELKAPARQVLSGIGYEFSDWSDGGLPQHFIATPATDQTFTVNYIQGTAFNGEYFNNKNLSGTPLFTRQDNVINFNYDMGSPDPSLSPDNFSMRWTKSINLAPGQYKFTTNSDDGVRLYIDNALVINKWIDQAPTSHEATVDLAAGTHQIKYEYYENGGGARVSLTWDFVGASQLPPTGSMYNAEYFNNRTLTGTPVLTRLDSEINFTWNEFSPAPSVNVDDFSARWTKNVAFDAGSYEFTVTADDGIRLFLDNQVIIDKWIDQGSTTYKTTKTLTAGVHPVKVEYYEHGGGAVAKFSFASTTPPIDPPPPPPPANGNYAATYFNNMALAGTPVLSRNETVIDNDWGSGSPDPLVNNDNFSARWIKTEDFVGGTYDFTARGDDGIRLYIDGMIVIDKWIDQGPTTYAYSGFLVGLHTIKFEYYENGGGAVAKLSYAKNSATPPPPTETYDAKFWNAGSGSQPTIPTITPNLTRTDNAIDFDWGSGSPAAGINADHFVAQWTKQQLFEDSAYRFTTVSDDGIRVYLDNVMILDQWNDHGPTTHTVDTVIAAGTHSLKVEFYENGGGAVAKVSFAKIASPVIVVPFNAEYFANMTLSGVPAVTKQETTINHVWNDLSPDPLIPNDRFSARWTKTQNYAAGSYLFTTKSDDGIRVFIDGIPVINNWTDHGMTTNTATPTLTAGNHTVIVEYYENGGGAIAVFEEQPL